MIKCESIGAVVVGYGYWGPNLARNLMALPQFELLHIVDLSDAQCVKAREDYPSCFVHSDLGHALGDKSVDAVFIATPPPSHFSLAEQCLSAGKHVLVEKPICKRREEADNLILLAKEKNLVLGVDHTFLFSAEVEWLSNKFSEGFFGQALYFHSERLNLGLIQEGASVVWDLAPHDLSILLHIIGERPSSLSVMGGRFFNAKVAEVASLALKFSSGVVATINLSWLSPIKVRRTILGGSKKMAVYDDMQSVEKIKVYDRGVDLDLSNETSFTPIYRSGDIFSPALDTKEPLREELLCFYQSVKRGEKLRSDALLGRDIVAILEACDESMKRLQFVEINYG